MPIMLAGAAELADGLRALQERRFSVPRSTLEAELDSLVERYGEAEVAAVFEARRKKPRGRPSRNYFPHLMQMALTIAIAAQSRAPLPGKRRTVFDKKISLAAKKVAVGTPQYDATHRKDVAKTLRQKFKKVVYGNPADLVELLTLTAILYPIIISERLLWAPFKDHPDGAAIFAKYEAMEANIVHLVHLLEKAEAMVGVGSWKTLNEALAGVGCWKTSTEAVAETER